MQGVLCASGRYDFATAHDRQVLKWACGVYARPARVTRTADNVSEYQLTSIVRTVDYPSGLVTGEHERQSLCPVIRGSPFKSCTDIAPGQKTRFERVHISYVINDGGKASRVQANSETVLDHSSSNPILSTFGSAFMPDSKVIPLPQAGSLPVTFTSCGGHAPLVLSPRES